MCTLTHTDPGATVLALAYVSECGGCGQTHLASGHVFVKELLELGLVSAGHDNNMSNASHASQLPLTNERFNGFLKYDGCGEAVLCHVDARAQ